MGINEVVQINITRQSAAVSTASLSTPLIVVESTAIPEVIREFSDITSLLSNNLFGSINTAYKAALALKSQSPNPEKFMIACKGVVNRNCKQRLIFDAAATAGTFDISYNGVIISAIPYNVGISELKEFIETFNDITEVTVTEKVAAQEWLIEFTGESANKPFSLFEVNVANLTGPDTGKCMFCHQAVWPSGLAANDVCTFTIATPKKTYTFSFDLADAPTTADVQAAIDAAIGTGNCIATPESDGKTFTLEFFNNFFGETITLTASASVSGAATIVAYYQGQAAESYDIFVDKVMQLNNNWYSVSTPDLFNATHQAQQKLLAAFIEAIPQKIYSILTSDPASIKSAYDVTTPIDILSYVKSKNYTKSFVTYHSAKYDDIEYPTEAILGKQLSKTPGSSTYKFKVVSGITPEVLTDTAKTILLTKNANWFEIIGGVNIYREGTCADSEFIEIITGTDYLTIRMAEYVYGKLIEIEKLSFSVEDFVLIESLIRASLKLYGVNNNFIDAATITVTIPELADISTADKKDGILKGVAFSARIKNAIHKLYINGYLYI